MRCYGSVASADTRKAEAVALRRKVASLKRQIQQLKKSLVK
jgi:polyhydroxyalkanoate synthesis regulator phasin